MKFINKLVILLIVLLSTLFVNIAGKKHGQSRQKRMPGTKPKNKHIHKYLNKGATVDCFQAFDDCRQSPKCRSAIHALDKKCRVVSGQCSAEKEELNRCGEIMDFLFLNGFPENKCRCEHNLQRCFKLYNKIYANPCFAAVRRHRQEEAASALLGDLEASTPLLEPLKDRETGILHRGNGMRTNRTEIGNVEGISKSTISVSTSETESEEILIIPEFDFDDEILEEELVFGDEGFAKPPPKRKTTPSQPTRPGINSEDEKDDKLDNAHNRDSFNEDTGPKSTLTSHYDASDSNLNDQGEHKKISSSNNIDTDTDKSNEDSSDIYRAIGIALGLSFGISIFITIIYLILKRAKASLFYKNGRVIRKISENGGSSARLKSDSSFGPSRA
ncbi:uncharacterized protein LOC120339941 [Styela clava]